MAYVYSLNEVGKFADAIGEDSSPYYSKADEILPTAEAHFNGDYVYESTNRQVQMEISFYIFPSISVPVPVESLLFQIEYEKNF